MPEDRWPSSSEIVALHAEWRADEAAARARDRGEADAATQEQRDRDGESPSIHPPPVLPMPVEPGLGRVLDEIERSWARREGQDERAPPIRSVRDRERGLER